MTTYTHTSSITAAPLWQTDPRRIHYIALARGDLLSVFEHADPTIPSTQHAFGLSGLEPLAYLISEALRWDCAALWLVPPHGRDWLADARNLLGRDALDYRTHELTREGQLCGLVVQRKSGGMPMGVYLVDGAGDPWGIAGRIFGASSAAVAQGLMLAAYALGMQLRFSPSYTGLQLLRQTLAHRRIDIPALSPATRELVTAHAPTYVQWSRPIADTSDGAMIYKYDRNSSFIASAGEVPVGDPYHFVELCSWDRPGKPGLFHVRFEAPLGWPEGLPGPFHIGEGAGEYPLKGEAWAWEPQLRLAHRHGFDLVIDEGYCWPEKHDLLRAWRERIWAARQTAAHAEGAAGAIAKGIIKAAGVRAVGRLNQQRARQVMQTPTAQAQGKQILHRERDEEGTWTGLAEVIADFGRTDLIRPDWWATIIANATERLFYHLYRAEPYHPIAAYIDAVYCLREWSPEMVEADRLGKFKRENVLWLNREGVAEWNALPTAAARVKLLARVAREQGQEIEADDGEADD